MILYLGGGTVERHPPKAVTLVGWLTELMKNGGVDGNLETRTLLR